MSRERTKVMASKLKVGDRLNKGRSLVVLLYKTDFRVDATLEDELGKVRGVYQPDELVEVWR